MNCPKCGEEMFQQHAIHNRYECWNDKCKYFKRVFKKYKSGKVYLLSKEYYLDVEK